MGDSNGEWGEQTTDAARERRDRWALLTPMHHAESKVLDAFLAKRGLTRDDLARVGARWDGQNQALCYFFADGLKWRAMDGRRWNEDGAEFTHLKIIRAQQDTQGLIIAEGETDAAALSHHAPAWDVAILPAGARAFPQDSWDLLATYPHVLVALDADKAGDEGAQQIIARAPNARRLRPSEGMDWCEVLIDAPWNGEVDPLDLTQARKVWFTLGEVLDADLGVYQDNHWFEHGIVPKRGIVVFHAAMKSLKSVVQNEMAAALATGQPFANAFGFLGDAPARVLMFQMEIPPFDYQNRLLGTLLGVPDEHRDALRNNFLVYRIADNEMPRLKVNDKAMGSLVRAVAQDSGANVLVFDPIQRMTGSANTDKANEMDPLLDLFEELQSLGYCVIFSHHNNKAGRNVADPYAMTGTQRFGADVDTICSLYHPRAAEPDDNPQGTKQRNFTWTLRNGFAPARSVTTQPHPDNRELMVVTFDEPITGDNSDVGEQLF